MTAKGNGRGQPLKGNQETLLLPEDTAILAARCKMSNIFLHPPQAIEKKGEIPITLFELWNYSAIKGFSLVTKRSAY